MTFVIDDTEFDKTIYIDPKTKIDKSKLLSEEEIKKLVLDSV